MAEGNKISLESPLGVGRLREEHKKVVTGCEEQIQHWRKVDSDYVALQERLATLPDQLSYDIMVPFGPLAFIPGKLVHTNEVTVLLGDNWFAKCSAKQAQQLVEHRKKHVKEALDDLHKVMKNFQARVGITEDLQKLSSGQRDFVDIREPMGNHDDGVLSKGKKRLALKPHSKPKMDHALELEERGEGRRGVLSEEELWTRLDQLDKQEALEEEEDRMFDGADANGDEDVTSSSSSEEEKEGCQVNGLPKDQSWTQVGTNNDDANGNHVNGTTLSNGSEDKRDDDEGSALPTIYFSHTVEPKKVRINTGKNTTLKFSERKEQKDQAKRKKKSSHGHQDLLKISSPSDIYKLFVDVRNGEPVPRKSILKSRSRENSVCSDTSESSVAEPDDSPPHPTTACFQAFSGTVVEKDPLPSTIPYLTITPPTLPTIPERKLEEVAPERTPQVPKRVSKFKAARLQQK